MEEEEKNLSADQKHSVLCIVGHFSTTMNFHNMLKNLWKKQDLVSKSHSVAVTKHLAVSALQRGPVSLSLSHYPV